MAWWGQPVSTVHVGTDRNAVRPKQGLESSASNARIVANWVRPLTVRLLSFWPILGRWSSGFSAIPRPHGEWHGLHLETLRLHSATGRLVCRP